MRKLEVAVEYRRQRRAAARSKWRDGVEFARRKVDFEPDEKQAVLLRTEAPRVILNCSRQWGKTSVGAVRAAWEMVRRPESCVVVLSSGEDLAAEFVWKVESYLRAAGEEVLRDARRRIGRRLRNGSRIVGMAPGEARARGMTATMLVLDEAAWIPDSIYEAVLPMVSSTRGSVWLMSTPGGKRGFFWEEWMRGEDWLRVEAPATECARIPAGFVEEMRRKRGEEHVRSAYLCEFVGNDDRLFDRDDIEALMATDVAAFRGNYGLHSREREFVMGVDLGKLTDYSAITVVERIPESRGIDPYSREMLFRLRNVVRHLERVRLGTSYPRVMERVRELARDVAMAGRLTVVVDGSGVGEPVLDVLRELGVDGELVGVTITGGEKVAAAGGGRWLVPKKEVVVGLQGMVVRRELEVCSDLRMREDLVEELVGMGRSLRAEGGGHDDLVMAVGLAAWRVRSRGWCGERGERLV